MRYVWMVPKCVGALIGAGLCGLVACFPSEGLADQLSVEQTQAEVGYHPIAELSYEAIITARAGYQAQLSLRIALHNAASTARDGVMTLALPKTSQLRGLAVAHEGTWVEAKGTHLVSEAGTRDRGTMFARMLPEVEGDVPAAEIVFYGLEPGTTTQVELQLDVHPKLRGDRWHIDLPGRGNHPIGIATERRVLVKGLPEHEHFWVDDVASRDTPFVLSPSHELVTVSWPAHVSHSGPALEGAFHVFPDRVHGGGKFRLYLRLGPARAARPKHVIAVIDRSRSTAVRMHRDAGEFLFGLFDALPDSSTFEAFAFARGITPLIGARASVRDNVARNSLARALDAGIREQGTDLVTALRHASQRAAELVDPTMIIVVTDGMVPTTVSLQELRRALEPQDASSRRRVRASTPEVLFVVDDPMLLRSGLAFEHAVTGVAAALGARIRLEALGQHTRGDALELLSSPRVLGDLDIDLPNGMSTDASMPKGLVAGNLLIIDGKYQGRAPRLLRVGGQLGARKLSRTLAARTQDASPIALVASSDTVALERAQKAGFALPSWYKRKAQRSAYESISVASRTGSVQRGHIDADIVHRYLRTRVLPRVRVCYNHALARNRDQAGRIVLELELGKGEVMLVRTGVSTMTRADALLTACVQEAAWTLDIPAGRLDDRVYLVRYPLHFDAPPGAVARVSGDPLGEGTVDLLLRLTPQRN